MPRSEPLLALSALMARRVGLMWDQAEPDWANLDAQDFGATASRHRVVGLALQSAKTELLPRSALMALEQRWRLESMRAMRQGSDLLRLLDSYDNAGIPVLLIKGQGFSELVYGDWTVRGVASDADFVIPPSDVAEAHRVMTKLGYYCDHDEGRVAPLAGWRGRYCRWLHYERYYASPDHLHVDVHWRPLPGSASWTRFDRLWTSRSAVHLHGRQVYVPGPVDTVRISAGQGVPDGWPNLRSSVDLLAAATLLGPADLAKLKLEDSLVSAALNQAPGILLHGNPRWSSEGREPNRSHLRREWQLRRRTDSLPKAAARSVLGYWAPARRLMPMDPATTHPAFRQ